MLVSNSKVSLQFFVPDDQIRRLRKGEADLPPLKGLSFLDRFLVLWILIAMGVGIAIGNTVESAGPALQKGEFVGVSIPIGKS